MRYLLFLISCIILTTSCTSREFGCEATQFDLVGKWGLIESCFDIGDGIQNCTDHNGELTYEFFADGTVMIFDRDCVSNYVLEDLFIRFSSAADNQDCIDASFFFGVIDACKATISPLCVDGCPHTYVKI